MQIWIRISGERWGTEIPLDFGLIRGSLINRSNCSSQTSSRLNYVSQFVFVIVFFSRGSRITWEWRWNRPLNSIEAQQLQQIQQILSHVSISDTQDKWVWTKESSSTFTVASMRKLLQNPPTHPCSRRTSLVGERK